MNNSMPHVKNNEKPPKIIYELVERFERNLPAYKSHRYKEDQLKIEFINPFFEGLGWDVDNKSGAAPAYRDVIHQDSIKMAGGTRAPDYCFTLAGKRMFFVEAKKPSVDIEKGTHPAYQLRRYAWSAKLSLSILTDFEEFAIYESRVRPKETDKATTERIMYLTYKDYIKKWGEIAGIFSYNAVMRGSFDRFVESAKKKRGTQEVDDAFLKEIEGWREMLARNIAIRNPDLSVRELNYAVQRTIDRIIFLRMCEDRGIERYGNLRSLTEKDNIYTNLCNFYIQADDKYNSGLFHFKKERGRVTLPDELTLNLIISNKVLRDIIKHLYYPESPYEFSVLSPEILGNVYEQFLGKVIRLTTGHRAKVEEKPEVKKAGGVYYTPQYVVDYIVENTIGKLVKNKTPQQISKLRVLDPACGSGSFLLGAYTYLLDYHLKCYTSRKDSKRYKSQIYKGKNGEWYLTVKEKKRILLSNIYGVDIDSQAVEVTKLSLLLKVLEGESRDVFEKQQKLWKERALPDLGNNIKCGNSLIGPSYYKGGFQRTLFGEKEIYRINAFDWNKEFQEIMENKGFDAVIGNPPWGYNFLEEELAYFRVKNKDIIVRMIDSFMYFIYQTSLKLKAGGLFGMIIPDVLLYQKDNLKLREYILSNFQLQNIVNLGNNVFKKVTRPCCICTFKKGTKVNSRYSAMDLSLFKQEQKERELRNKSNFILVRQKIIENIPNKLFIVAFPERYEILDNLRNRIKNTLSDYIDEDGIQRGASPDYKDAFIVDQSVISKYNLETEKLKDVLVGGYHVKRYWINYPNLKLIYTKKDDDFSSLKNICSYIDNFKNDITCVEVKQKKHPLYSLHRPRKEKIFLKEDKFVGVITDDKIIVAIDKRKYFATDGLYLFWIKNKFNQFYLLGILNSSLITFLYRLLAFEKGRVLAQVKPTLLYDLPVPNLDLINSQHKIKYDKMIKLVESMVNLHKFQSVAKTSIEKTMLQRQIDTIYQQIDDLVFDIYKLTPKEINIVKKSMR